MWLIFHSLTHCSPRDPFLTVWPIFSVPHVFWHCDAFFTLWLTFHCLINPFFNLVVNVPHWNPLSTLWLFFTVWHIFQSVIQFLQCEIFLHCDKCFSVTSFYSFTHIWHWPIFHTVTLPILLTVSHIYRVTHFSHGDMFFTLWLILYSMSHFSHCDPFFTLRPIFHTVTHFSYVGTSFTVTHFF